MKLNKLKLLGLFTFFLSSGFAQELIKGEVKDSLSGEPIFSSTIKVDGVGKAKTDFDGFFNLKLSPGDYVLTISNQNEGYIDKDVAITVVKDGTNTIVINLIKDKSVQILEGAVVVGFKIGGPASTLEAADESRQKETGSTDQLPKETIRNTGVSNAADAVQMVPAASVEDGKNVYIRGLGDRYTKTILNGMDIPGLDPDRNSVQMDIFPAVLIDNITVYKTATPNLTADFTGGLINIQTKDFPGKKTLYIKGGLGYNTRATFNPNFISYQGGKLDFLGFDDGTRALPIPPTSKIPHPASNNPLTTRYTSAFSPVMATQSAFSFLNQNYAIAMGNQIEFNGKRNSSKKFKYGYNTVLTYRSTNRYFGDVQYSEYLRDQNLSETKLFKDRVSKGELATQEVMWTALVGQSLKVNKNKFSLVLFHTQSATSSAANLLDENFDSNQAVLVKEGLQFTQRSITNANLSGLHYLDEGSKWKLNWKVSPTYSKISDPDIRSTALELREDVNGNPEYVWDESVGAEVRRIFRSLNEINIGAKVDLEYKFTQWDSLESKIAFGVLNTYKVRSFDVNEYVFRIDGGSNVVPNDPDWFFQPENIWTVDKGEGVYAVGQKELANVYDANQNISAAYIMNELPFSKAFSATYGVRVEKNVNRYTGQSNNAATDPTAPRYVNQVVLDELNVLPSVNVVYKIKKDADSIHLKRSTNFRGAYTQTLARPSFREISISQIYDPITGRRYLGNIDLKQTLIHNVDLRWEHFFGRVELVSASVFYKKFINPIEVVANVAAPNEFMPVNAGVADIYGAEFEIRKAIGFKTSDRLSLVLGTNFTYIVSQIDMNKVITEVGGVKMTEKEVREANARDGEIIGNYRPMYGQSPYIINAFLNFKDDSLFLKLNITYNVQGKRLAVVGIGSIPDVYQQPFHSLNLKISKRFGEIKRDEDEPRWQVSLRGQNLLSFARVKEYEAYGAENQIFEYLHPGMTFTGSISYTIR